MTDLEDALEANRTLKQRCEELEEQCQAYSNALKSSYKYQCGYRHGREAKKRELTEFYEGRMFEVNVKKQIEIMLLKDKIKYLKNEIEDKL